MLRPEETWRSFAPQPPIPGTRGTLPTHLCAEKPTHQRRASSRALTTLEQESTSQQEDLSLVLLLELQERPEWLRERRRESKLDKKNASNEAGARSHPGASMVLDGVITSRACDGRSVKSAWLRGGKIADSNRCSSGTPNRE